MALSSVGGLSTWWYNAVQYRQRCTLWGWYMVGLPSSGPVGLEGAQWEAQPGSSATYLFFYYSTIQLSTNLLFYYSTVHQSSSFYPIPGLLYHPKCMPVYCTTHLVDGWYSRWHLLYPHVLCHPNSTIPSQVHHTTNLYATHLLCQP